MPTIKRNESEIDFLIRCRFPTLKFALIPRSLNSPDYSSEYDGKDQQTKSDANAYRAELMKLSPQEIQSLVNDQYEQQTEAQRASVDEAKIKSKRMDEASAQLHLPDLPYWARQEEWSLVNAAILVSGIEPRRGLGPALAARLYADSATTTDAKNKWLAQEYAAQSKLSDPGRAALELAREIMSNARAAARRHTLALVGEIVTPRDFLVWARSRSYPVDHLESLIQDIPSIDALQQRLKLLEERLANSWDQFDPDDKQYPPELDIAFLAWTAVSKARAANGSPTERLQAWISSNYSGLTPETIKRIAIVANWAKKRGRKPSKKK